MIKDEPVHEISNNVVCTTSKASDQPAHTRSLIRAFASRLSMIVKLLTEHHLELLSLKIGCRGSSECTLEKRCQIVGNLMPRLIVSFTPSQQQSLLPVNIILAINFQLLLVVSFCLCFKLSVIKSFFAGSKANHL